MKKNFLFASLVILFSSLLFSQTPELTEPPADDQCVPVESRFEWTDQPNGPKYRILISKTEGDYTNPEVDQSFLNDNFYDATLSENSQTYYWKVIANYTSTFYESEEQMFVTQRVGTTVVDPSDETLCSPESTTFNWIAINDVNSYNIELSETESFNNVAVSANSGTSNSIVLDLPEGFTNYYWRVNGAYTQEGQACTTEWSNIFQLRSSVYPPELTSPEDEAPGVSFQPTIIWQGANGANFYNFQLSTTDTFGNGDLIYDEEDLTSFQFTASLDPTLFDKDYFWRVQSKESATSTCISEWSEPFKFTTRLESTTLTSPADLSQCVELSDKTFSWAEIGSSNTFQFQLDDDSDFSDPELDILDIADNEITIDLPDDNTVYYWRVRANSGDNTSEWSEEFELLSGIFSPIPDLPVDRAEDQFIAVNLEWDNLSNFSNQRLQVSKSDEFEDFNLVIDEVGISENEFLAVLPEYGQEYFWRVSSTLGSCLSGWSDVSSFSTYDGFPDLIFPERSQENLPLQIFFEWEEVPFADAYDIQLSFDDEFSVLEKARFDVEGTIYWITELQENSRYYWRVRSVNEYSKSPWSEPRTFRTGLQNADRPTTLFPQNNSEKIPTETQFRWVSSDNATSYDLQISTDNDFESVVNERESIEDTVTNISGLDNYETYYWRVRGKNQTTTSPWSNFARFRTIAPEVGQIPALLEPENEAVDLPAKELGFKWTKVNNTTDVDGGYQIQIATNESFAEEEMVVNARNVFRVDPLIFNLQALTTHYWRVRGWNEANDGPWSQVFSFTTIDPSSVNNININQVDIYPNPTNDNVNISFELENSGRLEVLLFNSNGINVAKIDKGFMPAGQNSFTLDELDLNSGKYIIMLKVDSSIVTYSITVTK